ncbi:hypothetical protein BDZ89DRAFT_969847, partial [Hymenopellis radicata]
MEKEKWQAEPSPFIPAAVEEEVDESWGPKLAALPEETSEEEVEKLVNLGPDILDNIKPRLLALLKKREGAFGVHGRLGKVNVEVPIPLKEGAKPVSKPMYAASPLKREVIEKQVNDWFEKGVIEKSTSPWGFPCVVVFRNGKPRL